MIKSLLLIEDNPHHVERVHQFFRPFFLIEHANDGLSGIIKAIQHKPDVLILSYDLLKLSGLEVCQKVRTFSDAPILMTCNSLTEDEKINCFDNGADDIIQAPFSYREMLSRINVLLRRIDNKVNINEYNNMINFWGLTVNKLTHTVHMESEEIIVTRKEFAILWMLVKNQNEVVTRKALISVIWGYDHLEDDRMIDTHLNRIRKKLLKHSHYIFIRTIWGVGYKIEKQSVFLPEAPPNIEIKTIEVNI
jgi:DNA-binding response OmpR family regulator